MKKINIFYWIFTGIFAAFMLFSAIQSIRNTPESIALVSKHLGYPLYFNPMLGIAKLLGVIALIVPGFPRIREWAYAGFAFDLIAATYSSIAVGDPASGWGFMAIFFVVFICSYVFYHKKLNATA